MCDNPLGFNMAEPNKPWERNRWEASNVRTERVRRGLWEFGNLALRAQYGEEISGPWAKYVHTPRRNENGDIEILVSTHIVPSFG